MSTPRNPFAVVAYAPGHAGREVSRHNSRPGAYAAAQYLWEQYGVGLDSVEVEHTTRGTLRVWRDGIAVERSETDAQGQPFDF